MPQRTRGVVLGLTTLIAGPAVAMTIAGAHAVASHPAPAHQAASTERFDGTLIGSYTKPQIPDREKPTPTPAPTATPAPRPVVVTKAVPRTPARTPAPAVNYPPGSVDAIIMAAAAKYGVDGQWMIRIASCESGERPTAVSSNGQYFGLFQFLQSTFRAHGGTDIFDPVQQSDITANMLAHGGARSWPVCSQR